MAARADDALRVEEQHDLLAQPRELVVRVRSRGTAATRATSRHSASGIACVRRIASLAPAAQSQSNMARRLLGVAGRGLVGRRTASGVPSSRCASASGSASTSRSLRAIVVVLPPRLVERAARLLELLLAPREDRRRTCANSRLAPRRARATPRSSAARSRACGSPAAGCSSSARKLVGPASVTRYSRCSCVGEARARHHLGVQALGRHEQDREVGGVRRADVLVADRLRLRRAERSASALRARVAPPACRRARARPAGAASPRAGTWRRPAASTAATRRRGRAGGSRTRRAVACRESSRRWSRTAAASARRRAARRAAPRPTCRAS